jgi:hypothetical protein
LEPLDAGLEGGLSIHTGDVGEGEPTEAGEVGDIVEGDKEPSVFRFFDWSVLLLSLFGGSGGGADFFDVFKGWGCFNSCCCCGSSCCSEGKMGGDTSRVTKKDRRKMSSSALFVRMTNDGDASCVGLKASSSAFSSSASSFSAVTSDGSIFPSSLDKAEGKSPPTFSITSFFPSSTSLTFANPTVSLGGVVLSELTSPSSEFVPVLSLLADVAEMRFSPSTGLSSMVWTAPRSRSRSSGAGRSWEGLESAISVASVLVELVLGLVKTSLGGMATGVDWSALLGAGVPVARGVASARGVS